MFKDKIVDLAIKPADSSEVKTNPLYSYETIRHYDFTATSTGKKEVILKGASSFKLGRDNTASLLKVEIGPEVKELLPSAFEGAAKLRSIAFSTKNKITKIPSNCFKNCSLLSTFDFGNFSEIEDGAFNGCSNISTIVLPETVTTLKPQTFANCEKLTDATIPNNIIEIPEFFFAYSPKLSALNLDNIQSIKNSALRGNLGFIDLKLDNLKTLGESVFQENIKLQSFDAHNLETIGNYAFYNCDALSSLKSSHLISIGDHAFQDCEEISSIRMGIDCTSIGDSAFFNCKNLSAFLFGYFDNDLNLTKFNDKALSAKAVPSVDDKNGFTFSGLPENWTITVPPYMYWKFIEDPYWSKFGNPLWNPDDEELSIRTKNQHIVTTMVPGKYDIYLEPNSICLVMKGQDSCINSIVKDQNESELSVAVVKIIGSHNIKDDSIRTNLEDTYLTFEGDTVKATQLEKNPDRENIELLVASHDSLLDIY